MSTKETYHSVIRANAGLAPLEDEAEAVKQAATEHQAGITRTLKIQWQSDEVTQQMFAGITSEIEQLEQRARELAVSSTQNNPMEIVNLLVRSAELRKLKQTYYVSNR